MWYSLVICLVGYIGACVLYHRCVRRSGRPVQVAYTLADNHTVTFTALSGDLGVPLVVREVLQEQVYVKHGIVLPAPGTGDGGAPLVVDIGCNIGLFALAVHQWEPCAIAIGAEPVRPLWELAVLNTTPLAPRGVVVPVGVGQRDRGGVPFFLDPHISAGASMYASTIADPMRRRPWHVQLAAVLRENAEVGNLPRRLTLSLCQALARPRVRWLAMLFALLPLVMLFIYLAAGGNQRRTVYGSITTLSGALRLAAATASSATVAARITGGGPIDLLKVDVEGAEMDVLLGIAPVEWGRIQQLVVEVHDIDNCVERIRALLSGQGFRHVVVDAESWASHEFLQIRSVYARRTPR